MKAQILALLGAVMLAAPALASGPITGRWVTSEKDAVVAIAKCGQKLCGRLERFLILPKGGKDQRDVNNADPAKRGRKLIGTAILYDLTEDDGAWRGQVYDPKGGRTYTSQVRRMGDGTLEVKGCFGPLCQTQVWRRAS